MAKAPKSQTTDAADVPVKTGTHDLPDRLKEFNGSAPDYRSRIKLIEHVIVNMTSQKQGASAGILLAGDPGVGKTSFIKQLARLFGMQLVAMEVPHISEEHMINIPFLVYNPATDKTKSERVSAKLDDNGDDDDLMEFDIVLSESNLYARLKKVERISEKKLLENIYGHKPEYANIRIIWEKLGGTKTHIPEKIQEVRAQYTKILFLDEFFRTTTNAVRNTLRTILNREIGLDKLPYHVYVVYASNMKDSEASLDEIPNNMMYREITMDVPDKQDWFGYLVTEANAKKRPIKKEVLDMFHTVIEQEYLSYTETDDGCDVRLSPRRWEQIIHYVNASLPCPNAREAKRLLTNVASNFTDYKSNETVSFSPLMMKAVAKLINDAAEKLPEPYTVSHKDRIPPYKWDEILRQQIKCKLMLGNMRSYIPVISGPPGIGKTTKIEKMIASFGLGYIHIDCSTLSSEDVMGIPLAKKTLKKLAEKTAGVPREKLSIAAIQKFLAKSKGGEDLSVEAVQQILDYLLDKENPAPVEAISTYFADSKLSKLIYERIRENPPSPKRADPKFPGYRYVIFLDELNRVKDAKTFNGLRKFMLEKEFDNGKKLPKDVLIIGAINPDGGNVIELTHHVRDVLDIIPTLPNWEEQIEFMRSVLQKRDDINTVALKDAVLEVVINFAEKWKTAKPEGGMDPHFLLGVDTENVYCSPRDYSQIAIESLKMTDMRLTDKMKELGITALTSDLDGKLLKQIDVTLREAMYEIVDSELRQLWSKAKTVEVEYLKNYELWFTTQSIEESSLMTNLLTMQVKATGLIPLVEDCIAKNIPFAESLELVQNISKDIHTVSGDLLAHFKEKMNVTGNDHVLVDVPSTETDAAGNPIQRQEYAFKEIPEYPLRLYGEDGEAKVTKNALHYIPFVLNEMLQAILVHNLNNTLISLLFNQTFQYLMDEVQGQNYTVGQKTEILGFVTEIMEKMPYVLNYIEKK